MDTRSLFEHLRRFDTPTIANALEIARGQRTVTGFTRQTLIAAFPQLPPIVGFPRAPGSRWKGQGISRPRIMPDAISTSESASTPWAPYSTG